MKYTIPILMTLLLATVNVFGQPPRRTHPLHPDTGVFVVAGQMLEGGGQKYAGLYSFEDCNGDGLSDWLAVWDRVDTSFEYNGTKYPKELFLYYGSPDGLPDIKSGYRIGPTQLGAYTEYLAHGDWNADGQIDLACRVNLFHDTSFNNPNRFIGRLVIFWGSPNGEYSISDTTILSGGAAMELGLKDGGVWDYNNDGIDDLAVRMGGPGYGVDKQGNLVQVPRFQIFRGRSVDEWRNSQAPRYADFVWWNPPEGELSKRFYDIDCDDYPDLVISGDDQTYGGTFAVLYGSKDGTASDTNLIEILSLNSLDEKSVKLIDVTNDKVLDLVILAGRFAAQRIMVWPGEPGKRVSEIVFRAEGDSLVLREPWASIPTTNALHDGWGDLGYQIYDLGDANLDGYNDIWAYTVILSADFFVCYSTNLGFDSLIDGIYRMDGTLPLDFANLGDIDGSGVPTIAMGYVSNSKGILFFKATTEIPFTGVYRELPHAHNVQRCFSTVSVVSDKLRVASASALGLQILPNPSSGEVRVLWRSEETEKRKDQEVKVMVYDALGEEMATMNVPAYQREVLWDASAVPVGTYFITVRIGEVSETAEIIVR